MYTGDAQLCGKLREGFVLAVKHVHLCLTILLRGIFLRNSVVGGGANHAACQDSLFGQRLGSTSTGQVVQGSVIAEEGFPFAGDEQVTRCVSVSGCVFR